MDDPNGNGGCAPLETLIDGACVPLSDLCGAGATFEEATRRCVPDLGVTCGTGTTEQDGVCVADSTGGGATCGEGTVLDNGACVPGEGFCPEGQAFVGDVCVDLGDVCGEGTSYDQGAQSCVSDASVTCGDGTIEDDGACVPDPDAVLTCGDGTIEAEGACVPDPDVTITCGDDTVLEDGVCVPDPAAGLCADGEVLVDGACVDESVLCSDGTTYDMGTAECVPDFEIVCGPGTEAQDGSCVPTNVTCGPGTTVNGDGQCIPIDGFCGDGVINGDEECDDGNVAPGDGCSMRCLVEEGAECVTDADCGDTQSCEPSSLTCVPGLLLEGDCDNPTDIPALIDTDTTLGAGGCFRFATDTDINNGATLRILPGVRVVVAAGVGVAVNDGFLIADGGDAPVGRITIEGEVPAPGHWDGLAFITSLDADAPNVLRNIDIRHGGGEDNWGGVIVGEQGANVIVGSDNVSLVVDNATFSDSARYGLEIVGPNSDVRGITNSTFVDNTSGSARVMYNRLGVFDDSNIFDPDADLSGRRVLGFDFINVVTEPQRWARGVPLVLGDQLTIQARLTLDPGAHVRVNAGVKIIVDDGFLVADGGDNPADRIVLEGLQPAPGYWDGLAFFSGFDEDAPSVLRNIDIRHGGGEDNWGGLAGERGANVLVNGGLVTLVVDNATFSDSARYGFDGFGDNVHWSIANSRFSNNVSGAVFLYPNNMGNLKPGNTFEGDGVSREVHVYNTPNLGFVTQDALWDSAPPWVIEADFTIEQGAQVSIQPGATLTLTQDRVITVDDGGLRAVGTTDQPITFTGATRAPGYWGTIHLRNNTLTAFNAFQNVVFEYGGADIRLSGITGESPAMLFLSGSVNTRVTLDNVSFNDSERYAIHALQDSVAVYGCRDVDFGNTDGLLAGDFPQTTEAYCRELGAFDEEVSTMDEHSIFVELAVGSGLFGDPRMPSAGTVFIPTNAAFNAYFDTYGLTAEGLLATPDLLRELLLDHITAFVVRDLPTPPQEDLPLLMATGDQTTLVHTEAGVSVTTPTSEGRVIARDIASGAADGGTLWGQSIDAVLTL